MHILPHNTLTVTQAILSHNTFRHISFTISVLLHCAGKGDGTEEVGLGRPVCQADFEGAMKRVGPSITRGSEVQVSPGKLPATHRHHSVNCLVQAKLSHLPGRGLPPGGLRSTGVVALLWHGVTTPHPLRRCMKQQQYLLCQLVTPDPNMCHGKYWWVA